MQKTRGNTIFTGAFMAFVLALWRRRSLILSAWIWRVSDIEAPSRSDWTTDMTKRLTSCTSQRWAMSFMDRLRLIPIRVSRSMRRNSSISGPSIRSTTFRMAPSRERPACTEIERRSSTSGSCRTIRSCLLRMMWLKTPKGRSAPKRRPPQMVQSPCTVDVGVLVV